MAGAAALIASALLLALAMQALDDVRQSAAVSALGCTAPLEGANRARREQSLVRLRRALTRPATRGRL